MKLHLLYFSPTGSTRAALRQIAQGFTKALPEVDINEIDCTLPEARAHQRRFTSDDVVIFGMPVYYGRVPALFHECTRWHGNGAKAAYVVAYGDRAFEDSLLELQKMCEANGFVSVSAAAFITQHSLNPELGAGRPHDADLATQAKFGEDTARKILNYAGKDIPAFTIKGTQPFKSYGTSLFIPVTDGSQCTQCGICAAACPVGCIDEKNFATKGSTACIACRACIKYCPTEARRLPAPLAMQFTQRMAMLRKMTQGNNTPEIFGL